MKYFKLIIAAVFLSTMFTGCSYVSDTVEGTITDRASFSATATVSGNDVIITWDRTDTGQDFAGIEIFRTSNKNDEYSKYELVASQYYNDSGLSSGITTNYTDTTLTTFSNVIPASNGVYFYRVAFFHWDKSRDERTLANGYTDPDSPDETNYYDKTSIDSISGYARVVIP